MTDKKGFLVGLVGLAAVGLSGCGGGGGSSTDDQLNWEPGVYNDPDVFKSFCANPRTGASAVTGIAFDDRAGSTLEENHWLRAWINDSYFWYDEVPDLNPANYETQAYFDLLKTSELTASGKEKDEFHFSIDTAQWEAQSQTGVSVGYGVDFVLLSNTVPREVVVALVEPDSPADMAGVMRGDRVLSVDGAGINTTSQSGVDTLNAGLFPADLGERHSFELQQTNGVTKTVVLDAGSVASTAVQSAQIIDTDSGPVGYFVFTTHNAPSERQLVDVFAQLEAAEVTDLILDLRYNGGGFLAIASQVAYMIAGPAATDNLIFESLVFNDKYPNTNPVTGAVNSPLPFFDSSLGFSVSQGQPLPHLDLPRVFVITTNNTCSASESIINSLTGIGIEVVQIGGVTCGKPFGFYGTDNCGTTYFSVQFQSVNALGFGDYADGFTSVQENALGAVTLPGCLVDDDYNHPLGDLDEAMLNEALSYRQVGVCSVASGQTKTGTGVSRKGELLQGPWARNRILDMPQ